MSGRTWRIGDLVEALPHLLVAQEPMPPGGLGAAGWYVAHVQAGSEIAVRDDLKALGVRAYVPMRTVFRRRPRALRRVRALFPVFPRYVFFEIVPEPRCWDTVRSVEGLLRVLTLTNNDAPAVIADEAIGDLMLAEATGLFDATRAARAGSAWMLAGSRVVVTGGPHEGCDGIVTAGGARAASVRLDGSPRPVRLPVDLLLVLV